MPVEISEPVVAHRTLLLDCGHQIEVPLGVAAPALAAGLVQHRLSCRGVEIPLSSSASSGYPLLTAPGVVHH
jgi:hypothetical protein